MQALVAALKDGLNPCLRTPDPDVPGIQTQLLQDPRSRCFMTPHPNVAISVATALSALLPWCADSPRASILYLYFLIYDSPENDLCGTTHQT